MDYYKLNIISLCHAEEQKRRRDSLIRTRQQQQQQKRKYENTKRFADYVIRSTVVYVRRQDQS